MNHVLSVVSANRDTSTNSTTPMVQSARAGQSLAEIIDKKTMRGELVEPLDEGKLRCVACGHLCKLSEGKRGICQVRYMENGVLRVPANYVAALQCDPIEKKPFFHVHPGQDALTFGMLGCDLHCSYCQNWITSQALRDEASGVAPKATTADELVTIAKRRRAKMVVSSYNEPLITAEWAVSVFKRAKAEGFLTGFVSNGNATPQVLDYIRPWTDCYKVDLKAFNDKTYRKLGATLEAVLATIKNVHQRGFWLEIVTLVIPGLNDSASELRQAAEFIAGVSLDIPWHLTAYHTDYKMENESTSVEHLLRAAEIGKAAGLRYVYAGNIPGHVGAWENTRCPHCATTLIERQGYRILSDRLSGNGTCYSCGAVVPGIWA